MKRWLPPLLIGLVAGAVAMLFTGDRLARLINPGPDGASVAQAVLRAVRSEGKQTLLTARFAAIVSAEQARLGLAGGSKVLVVPGTVRFELALNRIATDDINWTPATQTLRVIAPMPVLVGPEIDVAATRELRAGALLFALSDAEAQIEAANRGIVNEALLTQAHAPALSDTARTAAIATVTRTFLLPLRAAGFAEAKVVVTLNP